jgi:lipoate-protein ligase A
LKNWRLIPSSLAPSAGQMAFDEDLFRSFQPEDLSILRFFFFQKPTLTLGRVEAKHLDLKSLDHAYEIRPTGGRAVLHGEEDLCYSIIAPVSDPFVGGSLLESYDKISRLLAGAFSSLGREAELSREKHRGLEAGHCFSAPSTSELTLNGAKVAGGAQAREGGIFLQQGVILLSVSSQWKNLFPAAGAQAMRGLNDPPSLKPLSRGEVERSVAEAFEKAGVHFEEPLVRA